MSTTAIVIIVIVVVVVIGVVGFLASAASKRRAEVRRREAGELRATARADQPTVAETDLRAQEAEARATLARAEAERAEQAAAQERQGAQVSQAKHEDTIREADRIDPDVDHTADDYRPGDTV